MKTKLQNRTLWFDGTNEVGPSAVRHLFMLGLHPDKIVVPEQDEEIKKFNQLSDVEIAASKERNSSFDLTWNIPVSYLNIDIEQHLKKCLDAFCMSMDPNKASQYADRLANEILEIKKSGMSDLLRTLIYVVDTFKNNQVLWGVGRGSSCASLALFLIGLHKVDPVKFGIPLTEFFHD